MAFSEGMGQFDLLNADGMSFDICSFSELDEERNVGPVTDWRHQMVH
jgi:hypothetical protein